MNFFEKLNNGVAEIIPSDGLKEKLSKEKKLVVKLGFDPTAPDLHLGHAVVLRKLREFQDAGHLAVVIIGGFTACIGDPTGRDKARPPLSKEQIYKNLETYINQVSIVLDMDKVVIKNNDTWLNNLNLNEIVALLSNVTVAQMLQRNDFNNRFKNDMEIRLHEFLYPLLQGIDSVEIKADIEIGGTDQLFNTMIGRQLQKNKNEEGQILLSMPLLRGLDGVEKMSKSKNNYIGLTENNIDMYGKVMSIPDFLIQEYIDLASSFEEQTKNELYSKIESNPLSVKKQLAFNIVEIYHGTDLAKEAEANFERNIQGLGEKQYKVIDINILNIEYGEKVKLIDLCKNILSIENKNKTNSELRRLAKSGAIDVNNEKITDIDAEFEIPESGITLKIGKRGFYKI